MAVFVEAGRGRRKWEARKSISGAEGGEPRAGGTGRYKGDRVNVCVCLEKREQLNNTQFDWLVSNNLILIS